MYSDLVVVATYPGTVSPLRGLDPFGEVGPEHAGQFQRGGTHDTDFFCAAREPVQMRQTFLQMFGQLPQIGHGFQLGFH